MRRLLVALLLALPFFLVACGDDSDDSDDKRSSTESGGSQMATEPAPMQPPGITMDSGGMREAPVDATAERKEITTGSVFITAPDPIESAHKTITKVESLSGRVDNRTEQPGTPNTQPSASLTVRVPSDKTDQLVAALHEYGRVTSITITSTDVTLQVDDLDARIKALQASTDRLRALIAAATNTADLIEAENALSSRQAELDSLVAQKRHLDDQIDLSTLSIEFTTEDIPPPNPEPDPDSFWDGIVSGWNSVLDAIGAVVLFVGKAIPWVGLLGVIALLGWLGWRVISGARRGHRSKPEQAEQQEVG